MDGIKDFFGIHSPSKLFANLGGFMAEGLGEGFGDEMKDVSKSMQNAIPSDFDLDMNGTVSGFNGVQTQAFDITIPLSIDGVPLTKVISRIQWNQNKVTVRNAGGGVMVEIIVTENGNVRGCLRVISASLTDSLNGECTFQFSVISSMASEIFTGLEVQLKSDTLNYLSML